MAEDQGDKTEAPTPRRRQQAAEQGQVVRSQDLVAAALVVGAMFLLKKFGGDIMAALRTYLVECFGSFGNTNGRSAVEQLGHGVVLSGKALWPLMLGLVVIAAVGNIAQVGLHVNFKRIAPNLGALNPLKGFGRLFSLGGNPIKFLMNLAKMALIAFIGYTAIMNRIGRIITAQELEQEPLFLLAATTLYDV